MKVTRTENQIVVESAYNPDLPACARKLGGKWDSSKKVWSFDLRDEERVEALYREIYGEWPVDGVVAPAETVNVRIEVTNEDWYVVRKGIFLFGRQIANATGRDSGARLGANVVQLAGRIRSGGSVKNWATIADVGSVFELRDVPKAAVEPILADGGIDGLVIEIVGQAINREALLAEKEALLRRLDEIEKLLA